jgi:hypothetical protein
MMSTLVSPRLLLLGFLSWFIPFAAAFAFYGPGGSLWIPYPLFKSLMVVIGAASGLWLLLRAFRTLPLNARSGLGLGLVWMAINLLLDAVILVPFTGMDLGAWFLDIGLRYSVMAMMGWALGVAAERARLSA